MRSTCVKSKSVIADLMTNTFLAPRMMELRKTFKLVGMQDDVEEEC